ncbi:MULTISPECIES: helix-turn-helix transcriptional regulator [Pseudoalteromonas]|uniref:helix-turn-helix domain-containing protein n=1 Tax=Pseudoalteromonas TaxID=53246 RepID=UPI0015836411|nr:MULTISPECIES: helix-turn-helix transcriptional regulator [Pseudoalteromonas]MDI4652548.1 helix-turn-helix domain-containing protein [Pseudoalteromonas shioyasakiensis]NUJ38744.1 helix-turn-helix transcriptional regulator [Pseudoalteromonas sp. 0303]
MKLYDGEILKNARKSKGLTQEEVSDVLGIGRRQISQMENGIFDGGIKYFIKYLSLLNMELSITPGQSGWNTKPNTWPNSEENDLQHELWVSDNGAKSKSATASIASSSLTQLTPRFVELNKEIDSLFNEEDDDNEK